MLAKSFGGAAVFTTVSNSIRLDGVADYMSRTPSSTTNNKTYTISLWVRPSKLVAAGNAVLLGATVSGANYSELSFNASGQLDYVSMNSGGTVIGRRISSKTFRDFGNYYHIVVAIDTTNGTAASRIRMYANDQEITSFGTSVDFSLNDTTGFNSNTAHNIGRRSTGSNFFQGNISNICIVDGLALTPSDFAYTDANGKWRSKSKADLVTLVNTGGTNSTFLCFDDGTSTTTLGYDASSKGTNWTLNSMLRDGSTSDNWSYDSPTNVYNLHNVNRTLSSAVSVTFAETNTGYDSSGATGAACGCNMTPSTGKWYAEYFVSTASNAELLINPYGLSCAVGYRSGGTKDVDSLSANSAYGASWTSGDIIGIAMDVDNKQVTFYKNNVSQGAITWTVSNVKMSIQGQQRGGGTFAGYFNFGQRPVASGAWDSNAGGFFRYTPPSGYKAICTANLESSVSSANKNPESTHMVTLTDTGANIKSAAEAVFGSSYMYMIKDRDNSNNWQIVDNVRGSSAVVHMVSGSAETTYSTPSGNSVAHVWKTGGSASSNTSGSITSSVSANNTNGLSVLTYTGTGTAGTIGHGLSTAPKVVMVRDRDSSSVTWYMYHTSLTSAGYYIQPGSTNAQTNDTTVWNNTAPTSTVFSVGTNANVNTSGHRYIAYCFAEVTGYSAFGSYVGNPNVVDLVEIPLGFKPGFLVVKNITTATYYWLVFDNKRQSYNDDNNSLRWDNTAVESPADYVIRLSEGFRPISNSNEMGATGTTYIYMAFAAKPTEYTAAV